MNQSTTAYVGLDVHKDSVDIAVAAGGREGEVRHGSVNGDVHAVTKALRRMAGGAHRLHIVYEAGRCGYVLQRHLSALGWHCEVVAPRRFPSARAIA